MNLPNGLTLSRIFLVPLLLVALLSSTFPERELAALIVFIAASMTDYLDGYLARRRLQVTTVGKLLDPIADKLLISAAFISLVQLQAVAAWMVVVILGREFAVSALRAIASAEGLTIDASRLGKYKMASQVVCVVFLLLGIRSPGGPMFSVGQGLLWLVVALATVSMIQYFRNFWGRVSQEVDHRQRRQQGSVEMLSRRSQDAAGEL